MKITAHCEGTKAEIAKQLLEHAAVYGAEEKSAISIEDIKNKRGKGKTKPVDEDDAEDEVEADDEDDADDEEEEENEDDADDEEEEENEEEEETLSEKELKKLKAALGAYSKEISKSKAVAILKKFAERSDLVKPADLAKLLKLLKV